MPVARKRAQRGTTIRLPYPHLGQQRARDAFMRFNWLICGRRWRKTTMGISIAVEGNLGGEDIIWGAPTYDQTYVAFEECKRAALGVALFNEAKMTMRFPGIGTTYFRSLDDPDNARGHSAHGVIIDEISDTDREAWIEVLSPMLIDTEGWLLAMGTPKGYNWVYQEFEEAKARADSAAIQAPTRGYRIDELGHIHHEPHSLENTEIKWAEIERLWNKTCPLMPNSNERNQTNAYSFHQEIGASFSAAPGGLVYNTWSDRNVTQDADFQAGNGDILWAIDDGYVGRIDPSTNHYTPDSHPRVFLFAQMRKNGQIAIFDEDYAVEMREDTHIARAVSKTYPNPEYAVVDKSAAALKRWLHDNDIMTVNGPGDVEESIKELRSGIGSDDNGFRRVIVHPRCYHLVWEMQNYRRDPGTKKPVKEHDHGCDAARYLYWNQRLEA